jgi:cytidylate kinase
MVITIHGPAGSGKSTAARKLAARLEIAYLDTGAMYRAIAYAAQQHGVDFNDAAALLEVARSVELELDCGPTYTRVRLDGHDVSESVRSMAVSAVTPFVARHPGIRALLVERQRQIGQRLGSLVSEGRDQGSVVFPHADVKFVLQASVDTRAERRLREMLAEGEDVTLAEVKQNLLARDAVDTVQWQPLLESAAAIVIDTTRMTIGEVIERMTQIANERRTRRR